MTETPTHNSVLSQNDSREWSTTLVDEITGIVFGPLVEPIPCDVIFIFGGLDPGLWEWGARAYTLGLGRDVVVTGGYKPGVMDGSIREAHVILRGLTTYGVPEAVIVYEDQSTNTLENVLFAQRAFDFSAVSRMLAVCKCYGAGRQCRTLSWGLERDIKVVPYPFDTRIRGQGPIITRTNWMEYESSRAFILEQVTKIIRYGQMGHLKPLEHMSAALEAIMRVDP